MGLRDVWNQAREIFSLDRDQKAEIDQERFPNRFPPRLNYASKGKYYDGHYNNYAEVASDIRTRHIDYENMDDYPEIACLSRDSKVGILDSEEGFKWKKIGELIAWRSQNPDEPLYVLSMDISNRKMVVAQAVGPKKTGEQVPVVEVRFKALRGGEWSIKCTPDHLFMLRDGSYKPAGQLEPKDRLMPAFTKVNKQGYLQARSVWDVTSSGNPNWRMIHTLAAESILLDGEPLPKGQVVHHLDENKLNPHPSNLEIVCRGTHSKIHDIAKLPEVRAKVSAAAKARWDDPEKRREWLEARKKSDDLPVTALNSGNPDPKGILTEEHRAKIAASHEIPLAQDVVETALRTSDTVAEAARKLNTSHGTVTRRMAKWGWDKSIIGTSIPIDDDNNHIVVSVEPAGFEDVYDIEVPGYHNFACEDVFVHNSALDTYADEATQVDIWRQHRIWVEGRSDAVVNDLNFLLHRQLKVNGFQWELIRYLCKYGANLERMFINENGVIGTEPLPVGITRRVHDQHGSLKGFVVARNGDFNIAPRQFIDMLQDRRKEENSFKTFHSYVNSASTFVFEDFEVSHFRIIGKDRLDEYGYAVTEPARWVFRRLVMMEDSALVHRLTRAPSRYVFYVDTGNLPPEQALGHVQRVKDWYSRQKFVNPNTGKLNMAYNPLAVDEDFFVPVHTQRGRSVDVDNLIGPDYQCVTGDTFVPLLDGTEVQIRDLVGRDEFWVYSVNDAGEVVPGRGHSARRTKKAEVWEVELDSGEVVRCSDNHPFMLRDGSWKRADELNPDDSLMPLYREVSSFDNGHRLEGYERVFDPATGEYQYTHQLVHRWKTGSLLPQPGHVIHHANLRSKLDNRPEMLVEMGRSEHSRLHVELSKHLHSPEVVAKRLKTHRSEAFSKKMRKLNARPGIKKAQQERMRRRMQSPEFRRKVRAGVLEFNASEFNSENITGEKNPRWREEGLQELMEAIGKHSVTRIRDLYDLGFSQNLVMRILSDEGYSRWSDFAKEHIPGWKNNHRVVAVRRTGKEEWLYDITVDETHNFAVGQGVVVHNSVDDVDYFRKKLGRAIKIPNFGLDNDAQARPLTQEDIRFAAAVMRVQQANCEGWSKVCSVHLASTGRNPYDSDWSLHMPVPSAIMELARMEVLSAKADVMSRLQESVSVRWLLTKLFGFSEEESVNLMVMRQEELDMLAVAEIDREVVRDKALRMEGVDPESSRVASLNADQRSSMKLSAKARTGALGVSEREYNHGHEPDVERFVEKLKNDKELMSRLGLLEGSLRSLNKKADVLYARSRR